MSDGIVMMMIGVSTLLGAIGLIGLVWAVRNGHFDDHEKFVDAVRHDNVEDLRDAAELEARRKRLKEQKRRKRTQMPPD